MTNQTLPWEDGVDRTPTPDDVPLPTLLEDDLLDGPTVDAVLDELGENPLDLATTTARLRDTILDRVRNRGDVRRADRVRRLDGDDPASPTDVRREVVGGTLDADVLSALGGAFLTGATEARAIAAGVLDELPGRGGKPRASLKVADGHGFELTMKREQRRDLSVDVDQVVDVLVSSLVSSETDASAVAYADGIRAGIAAIREVLSTTPTFRSTALDSLATRLENAEEEDLARRLRKAYGRVEVGEPRVTVDRKPIAPEGEK